MVNFAFDSAQLDNQVQATLRKQAHWIRQFPEIRFRVYGHTDAVGSTAHSKQLSLRRVNAVVQYLSTQGINRNRLEAVVSFDETQPVVVTQARDRRNRRILTEVSGFVKRHPTVFEVRYAEVVYRNYRVYREYIASATSRTVLTGIAEGDRGGE